MFPLLCRARTSDRDVFRQIFLEREYSCLDGLADARTIVDCGANVGYSSAYFLSRYPRSRVIAVEPDPRNFAWLQRNLEPYGDRVSLRCSAIWRESAALAVAPGEFGDGREWATQVRPARPGEVATIQALTIGDVLDDVGCERIDILKIDIEGAEAEVFRGDVSAWLGRVNNLVIELHGDECRRMFFAAISEREFEISRSGELTVCRRRSRID
ncbi:MAG: FkbM family methyltransferase [Gemmatimonadaceae bacterium]